MFDEYNFKPLFKKLKNSKEVKSNEALYSAVSNIFKYADNDKQIAFMLGYLVKSNNYNLSENTKDDILSEINEGRLRDYFFLRKEPEEYKFWMIIKYFFPVIGAVAIAAGIFKLINGDFRFGLSIRYAVPVIREGGYFLLLGLLLFIGGFIRLRHERKRIQFLNDLRT